MLSNKEKKEMKRYRHLIASMITVSEGYFTPLHALSAIKAHKKNTPFICEMTLHYASLAHPEYREKMFDMPEQYLKDIMNDIYKDCWKNRNTARRKKELVQSKRIVDLNTDETKNFESIGASWF